MSKYIIIFFNMFLSILAFGNMSITPFDFDFDLTSEKERVFTIINTGDTLASYNIELEKKMPISKYINMKKLNFLLSPGEKKEFKITVNSFGKKEVGEFLGKIKILEQQKIKNMNYEIKTGINIYGYIGELEESFLIENFKKDSDNILFGEIKNNSKRKIDILLKGETNLGDTILTRKIRVLKDGSFNLLDLGNLDELSNASKIIFETSNMKKEFKFQ